MSECLSTRISAADDVDEVSALDRVFDLPAATDDPQPLFGLQTDALRAAADLYNDNGCTWSQV